MKKALLVHQIRKISFDPDELSVDFWFNDGDRPEIIRFKDKASAETYYKLTLGAIENGRKTVNLSPDN